MVAPDSSWATPIHCAWGRHSYAAKKLAGSSGALTGHPVGVERAAVALALGFVVPTSELAGVRLGGAGEATVSADEEAPWAVTSG